MFTIHNPALPPASPAPLPSSPSQDPTSTQPHAEIQPGDQTYATANDFTTNHNNNNNNDDYEYQSPPRSRLPVGRGSGIPRGTATGMRGRGGTVRGRVVSAPAGGRAGAAGVTERKKREVSLVVSLFSKRRSCGRYEGSVISYGCRDRVA
jgi:hypothetical protein